MKLDRSELFKSDSKQLHNIQLLEARRPHIHQDPATLSQRLLCNHLLCKSQPWRAGVTVTTSRKWKWPRQDHGAPTAVLTQTQVF